MSSSVVRPLAGLATVVVLAAIVFFAIGLFNGGFGRTVPVTVVSERAGLVMNPEAKVKMRGVQVGQVEYDRDHLRRQGGPAPRDEPRRLEGHSRQRARQHHVLDGLRRQVRGARRAAVAVCQAAGRGSAIGRPARDGRDQHLVPAAHLGAQGSRPGEAQRNPGRDLGRAATAAARSWARRSPTSASSSTRSTRASATSAAIWKSRQKRSAGTPTPLRNSSTSSTTPPR